MIEWIITVLFILTMYGIVWKVESKGKRRK